MEHSDDQNARVYDMTQFPAEDLIDILIDENFNGNYYMDKLDVLNRKCCRGGTKYHNNKMNTFEDYEHPACVVRFEGKWLNQDVSTAFLVRKGDQYNSAYCHDCLGDKYLIGSNWRTVPGSLVWVTHSVSAAFEVSYNKDLVNRIENRELISGEFVGKEVILSALYYLKYGTTVDEQQAAFHVICHHLCEASRFSPIADFTREAIDLNENKELGHLMEYYRKWSKLSKIHRNKCLNNQSKAYYRKALKNETYQLLKITNYDVLERVLRIMLREKERDRVSRRLGLVKKNPNPKVKKYYDMAKYERIKKKEACWDNTENWTRSELEAARDFELSNLIRTGGVPEIWRCLHESCIEPDPRYTRYKIKNTNVNLMKRNISKAIDDNGHVYKFRKAFMLCDPRDGLRKAKRRRKH